MQMLRSEELHIWEDRDRMYFIYNAVYCKRRTFLALAFEIGKSVSSPCRLKCFEASKTQVAHWS